MQKSIRPLLFHYLFSKVKLKQLFHVCNKQKIFQYIDEQIKIVLFKTGQKTMLG